jgi:predicted nucleotidyltransferase
MPSAFTDFAASRFLNRDRILREVDAVVELLKSDRPDVKEIYLFGSFAWGVPTPKSDIDLLIVADESEADALSPYFLSVSIPVDLYMMTPESFRRKRETGKGIVGAAAHKGIRLL